MIAQTFAMKGTLAAMIGRAPTPEIVEQINQGAVANHGRRRGARVLAETVAGGATGVAIPAVTPQGALPPALQEVESSPTQHLQ